MRRVPYRLPELGHLEPVAPSIWPRRVFHCFAGSTLPLLMLFAPHWIVDWLLIGWSILAVMSEVGRGLVPFANDLVLKLPLFKPKERYEIMGSTFLILSATLVYFIFDKEFAVLALIFLAVGDPMAAMVGIWDPKFRVFGKSVVGTAAFVVAASATGFIVSLHPDVPSAWWIVPGAFVAGVAELLPLPLDDNIVIPFAGATTMALLAML